MPTRLQGTIQRLDLYAGTLTQPPPVYRGSLSIYLPEMSAYYLLNRYDITALTGGTPSKLDGFDITGLKQGKARVALYFADDVLAIYRLADKGAETQSLPWRIISMSDANYIWRLECVMKQGVPCVWNPTTAKFHQVMADGSSGAVALEVDQSGFSLPNT